MTRKARFTVTLTEPSSVMVTTGYHTTPGTAVPGTDYTPVEGTLTFSPGQTSWFVDVPVRASDAGKAQATFTLDLSDPVSASINDGSGLCILPGTVAVGPYYLDRFNWIYDHLHDNQYGYFGPQTPVTVGSITVPAFVVPRHIPFVDSKIIAEAPDYGGESVSETLSFWIALETWKGQLSQDWTGFNKAWTAADRYYIPSATNQPTSDAAYLPDLPATYVPEGDTPSTYPQLGNTTIPVGVDPLYEELKSTYSNDRRMYLMHWIIDVEGDYGFRNGDNVTKVVFINTFERGLQESTFECITHPCWDNWDNAGSEYGYQPLYVKGLQVYPEAEYDWGKKYAYTNAPDAEGRALQWTHRAIDFATAQGHANAITASVSIAKRLGDYCRYNLFDKFFRVIGSPSEATTWDNSYASCHFLWNWYSSWGGEIPTAPAQSSWGYRLGCSVAHQGYQSVGASYAMASGGGGMTPQSASAGDIWLGALYRQVEMIRWLQSPEGPIAGGVTNSYDNNYLTPTDGRQSAKFYGMYYEYSPVWHDPPSNNWAGFQCWGQGHTADLFLHLADQTSALAITTRNNIEIILNRLVAWFLDNVTLIGDDDYAVPGDLSWVSNTQISGQTATTPNLEGVYEYLPTLEWPGSGSPDYSTFWDESTVPNPNLHCTISGTTKDVGTTSSLAYLLIAYAQGKRILGKFTDPIPNSAHTAEDAMHLADELLDRIWYHNRDDVGVCITEPRSDYNRIGDPVYVPMVFTGAMPNGDPINQSSTFASIRSFIQSDAKWPEVQAYIDGAGPPPEFTYHRFWAQVEFATACAAMHTYFGDIVYSEIEDDGPQPGG